ncbi:hypothetical protein JCM10213_002226 [Rhodosporidiobolus nylandii]
MADSMIPQLPLEVVALVVKHLRYPPIQGINCNRYTPDNLRHRHGLAIALVCRAWRRLGPDLAWREVSMDFPADARVLGHLLTWRRVGETIVQHAPPYPSLRTFEFSFRDDDNGQDDLFHLLAPFTSLSSLDLDYPGPPADLRALPAAAYDHILPALPFICQPLELRHLTLMIDVFDGPSLERILPLFSNLAALKLKTTPPSLIAALPSVTAVLPSFPHLTKLVLDVDTGDIMERGHGLNTLPHPPLAAFLASLPLALEQVILCFGVPASLAKPFLEGRLDSPLRLLAYLSGRYHLEQCRKVRAGDDLFWFSR